ncbi:Putative HC-toxin efflux carrier TOXA [Cytospora mali]|uniref:HC-toxin efflux carrier TOXA n=1 Tax=Cytospora mali TaxID=578113 RepID=A0A194W592_CYTMA|nr:Putative HC-toxin efflux carrier TOXA [Valsa mali]
MQLFRRAKKPDQAVDPSQDVSITSAPHPDSNPTSTVAEVETEKNNPIGLARTRTEDIVYPSGLKLTLLMTSVFMAMFLVALDRLIVSTAIPQITDDFHSVTDIGWYGSAYLLTNCAFQLSFGKLYTFYSVKWVLLTTILFFEVGSAICGAAPSSVAFIVGRAIAGLGSAGIMSGAITVIVYAIPLHKRPLFQGLFGAVFGLASVIGPLLGGAFTSNVSWRWCFYINLPFGGIAMVFIFFLLQVPDRETTHLPNRQKLSQLDFVGLIMLLPGTICLLLALQWGGLTYAWGNGRIIALLTLGAILLIGFVLVQIFMPDTATVPPRIFVQRSIMAGLWSTFCIGASMMILIYYLPVWFQAIKGVSAVNSGVRLLPMVLPMVVSSITSGVLISKIGYYTPFMLFGVVLLSVGAGLLTTLQVDTGEGKWIGYQVIFGFGMGMTFQAPNLAAQTVLPTHDVPIGTSLMLFSQLLSGAIFISVGQNVLDNELLRNLAGIAGFDASTILNSGATTITALPEPLKSLVLVAYNAALRKTFQVGLVMTCLTIFGAATLEWRSVKGKKPSKNKEEEQGVKEAEEGVAGTADTDTAEKGKAVGGLEEKEKTRSVDHGGNGAGNGAVVESGHDTETSGSVPVEKKE